MTIRLLVVVLLLGVEASCHKEEILEMPSSANPRCFDAHPVVRQVKNLNGRVGYRQDVKMYTVNYHVPGTIDSQWTGLLCNVPVEYQSMGKEVRFSGEYRSTAGKISSQLGGEEIYYLYLSSIK